MIATLRYKLPEEREEFDMAINVSKYVCVIDVFDDYLRRIVKYEERTEEEVEIYNRIRDKLSEIKIEFGII